MAEQATTDAIGHRLISGGGDGGGWLQQPWPRSDGDGSMRPVWSAVGSPRLNPRLFHLPSFHPPFAFRRRRLQRSQQDPRRMDEHAEAEVGRAGERRMGGWVGVVDGRVE